MKTVTSSSCSVSAEWRLMSEAERMFRSDIVLYGRSLEHVQVVDSSGFDRTDATFDVFCSFKQVGSVENNITIIGIMPRHECSRTILIEGSEFIIGVRRHDNMIYNQYAIHEVNPLQKMAFEVSDRKLSYLTRICGMSDVRMYNRSSDSSFSCPRTTSTSGRGHCISHGVSVQSRASRYHVTIARMLVLWCMFGT